MCLCSFLLRQILQGDDKPNSVSILLDMTLAPMPMECLSAFTAVPCTRDFSLPILCGRMVGMPKPNFNGAFKFVVDPVSESAVLTAHAKALKKVRCCGSWKGVTGAERTPSPGEYMRTLQEASGFMFLGPNRFAGYLAPEYTAGLDAPKCSIVFLLDRIAIDASNRRQMKGDNGRTKVCRVKGLAALG